MKLLHCSYSTYIYWCTPQNPTRLRKWWGTTHCINPGSVRSSKTIVWKSVVGISSLATLNPIEIDTINSLRRRLLRKTVGLPTKSSAFHTESSSRCVHQRSIYRELIERCKLLDIKMATEDRWTELPLSRETHYQAVIIQPSQDTQGDLGVWENQEISHEKQETLRNLDCTCKRGVCCSLQQCFP